MRALRLVAIAIAVGGLIDPALTSTRRSKPLVSVVAANPMVDAGIAKEIAASLRREHVVIEAPLPGAAATVVVGDQLPATTEAFAPRAFVVLPERGRRYVAVEGVRAPARVPLDARTPIAADVRVVGGHGTAFVVLLMAGDLVLDRVTRAIDSDDWRGRVSLTYVPTAVGAARLRVVASSASAARPATGDVVVDVRDDKWNVLFFDRRPSWLSTFVRRATELDPRFTVTSRIITSRTVSTDAGRPPAGLDVAGSLAEFDVIVVGAPDALTGADVTGLDAFMRRRGGSVVLLLDQPVPAGGASRVLTSVRDWSISSSRVPLPVETSDESAGDEPSLRAAQFIWPEPLPPGATAIARDSALNRPIVWRSAVGAGQLIVSGALDAWHLRDPQQSGFASFWQRTIAGAAASSLSPVDVSVPSSLLVPGEESVVDVRLRDVSLPVRANEESSRATASAALQSADSTIPLRLWPGGDIGHLRAAFRAPATPGPYQMVVSGNGARVAIPIVVADDVARPTPDHAALLRVWSGARGGVAVHASQLDSLRIALANTIGGTNGRVTWYPMRSAWWIVPFTLLLGIEWWSRRRRGLA